MKHIIYTKVKCNFFLLVIWLNCHPLWPKRWILGFQFLVSSLDLQVSINTSLFRCFCERKHPIEILPRSHLEWDFPISPHFKDKLHLISRIFTVRHIHFPCLRLLEQWYFQKWLLYFSEQLLVWILIFTIFCSFSCTSFWSQRTF